MKLKHRQNLGFSNLLPRVHPSNLGSSLNIDMVAPHTTCRIKIAEVLCYLGVEHRDT